MALVALGFAAAGCTDDVVRWNDLPPIEDLPWREPVVLPLCTPWSPDFALPTLPAPAGRVQIENPVRLFATGLVTTLDLVARDPGGAIDGAAGGVVALDLAGGGTVLEVPSMVAGRARARVRFTEPGTFTATATLTADGRTGTTALATYRSQLPVWELTIDPVELAAMEARPQELIQVPAGLTIDGVALATKVRLHGGSSRDFEKKSFRFDLAAGLDLDGHDHLILRAEWNDKTLLRNWLALALVRSETWLAAPAAELVHFRINERFYGLMDRVERVDRDFLRARGLSTGGSLYEAASPTGAALGDLTPLPPAQYPIVYPLQAGSGAHLDLRGLIEDVLRRGPGDFEVTLLGEVEVDDVLVYLAAMAVIQNQDHVRKNYYLYRDPALVRGWTIVPWDLDLTFGHLSTEANDVLDEAIVVDGDPFVGALPDGAFGPYNALIDRLLDLPELRARFVAMTRRIVASEAARGLVDAHLAWAVCRAQPELLTDERKRADNAEYLGRVGEIRGFAASRRAFLEGLPD